MRVVTSGAPYLDIDGYAGILAFAELLRARGEDAVAASTSILNETVPSILRQENHYFQAGYKPTPFDTFTIIDVSDPAYFDKMVAIDRVDEIIDHHLGFEHIWAMRPNVQTDIEFIGAAATQIYQRWLESGLLPKISQSSAKLLACGILDNTLNLGAELTTSADHSAYLQLAKIAGLDSTWPEHYFSSCEQAILTDIPAAILNDSKVLSFKTFHRPLSIGQLVVWDADPILKAHQNTMQVQLTTRKPDWFMNLISLKDRKSIFVAPQPEVKAWLSKLLQVKFIGASATAGRPWLRKEMVKKDLYTAAAVKKVAD